jgi:hypothetical protein
LCFDIAWAESPESSVVRIFCFCIPTWIPQEDEGEEEEEEEHEPMSDDDGWGLEKEDTCGKCEQFYNVRNPPFRKWYARDQNNSTFHVHVWCHQCWVLFDKTEGKKYEDLGERDKQDVDDLIPQQGFP